MADVKAQVKRRFGDDLREIAQDMGITPESLLTVYKEGMKAEKSVISDGETTFEKVPDHRVRRECADSLAKLLALTPKEGPTQVNVYETLISIMHNPPAEAPMPTVTIGAQGSCTGSGAQIEAQAIPIQPDASNKGSK